MSELLEKSCLPKDESIIQYEYKYSKKIVNVIPNTYIRVEIKIDCEKNQTYIHNISLKSVTN